MIIMLVVIGVIEIAEFGMLLLLLRELDAWRRLHVELDYEVRAMRRLIGRDGLPRAPLDLLDRAGYRNRAPR